MTPKDKMVIAVQKGYYIDDFGFLFKSGVEVKGSLFRVGNYTGRKFSLRIGSGTYRIKFGRLMAYQKFGDKIFEAGIVVRHLDGNPLNNSISNIDIGTPSQNCLDRDKVSRQLHAKYNGKKYSDETVRLLKEDRLSGMTYKKLIEKYGMAKSTLSYYLGKSDRKRAEVIIIGAPKEKWIVDKINRINTRV